jgi:hypothetical protein
MRSRIYRLDPVSPYPPPTRTGRGQRQESGRSWVSHFAGNRRCANGYVSYKAVTEATIMQNCEAFLRRVQRHTNKQAVRAWPRAQDRAIRLLPVNTTTRRILQGFSFQLEVLAFLQVSQGERAMSRTPRPSSQHHTASSHSLPVAHALRSRFRSNHCACTRSANSTPVYQAGGAYIPLADLAFPQVNQGQHPMSE